MQALTIALGNYGVTKPIKAAGANLGRLNLRLVEVDQIVPMMRRMCRKLEFDGSIVSARRGPYPCCQRPTD